MLNQIELVGIIEKTPALGQIFTDGNKSFLVDVSVERESGVKDVLPLKIPVNATLENIYDLKGKTVSILGEIRTFNEPSPDRRGRLIVQVFVKWLIIVDDATPHKNFVQIDGYICKTPVARTTPFGREIADIMLANQRAYNKSSYIPCITWGRNANYVSLMNVGDLVTASGRLQSRIYQKTIDGVTTDRVTYELSLGYIELIEANEDVKNEGNPRNK